MFNLFKLSLIGGTLGVLSACFSPALQTDTPQGALHSEVATAPAPMAQPSTQATIAPTAKISETSTPPLQDGSALPIKVEPTASPNPAAPSNTNRSYSSSSGGGGGSNAVPTPPPGGNPYLDDVIWIGQGSIKPEVQTQPVGIKAQYAGKSISLRLTGYFYNPVPESVFITLDHQIPLEPTSVSNTRIDAQFNTAFIPDLYLVGSQHLLSIQVGDEVLHTNIRVETPDSTQNLSPQIQKVTVIEDEEGYPQQLKITGHHFMRNPNFAQCKIDQAEAPILESHHDGTEAVLTVLITDSEAFLNQSQHQISYHTPFGLTIHYFNHEEGTR